MKSWKSIVSIVGVALALLAGGKLWLAHGHRLYARGGDAAAASLLAVADSLHRAAPDSVKAYEDLLRKAVEKAAAQGDARAYVGSALQLSAQLQWTDEAEAEALAEQALAAARKGGPATADLLGEVNLALGGLSEQKGDTARARALYSKCLADSSLRNTALSRLANLRLQAGDVEGALSVAREMTFGASDSLAVEPLLILANCYLQCDSLAAAKALYVRLGEQGNVKTRYVAQRHLAEIAIRERNLGALPGVIDTAFAYAEDVFFEALQQKESYYRATLAQERREERMLYHGRMMNWALLAVVLIGALAVLFVVSQARHRRIIHDQRLQAEQRERELTEQRLRQEEREREREAREASEQLRQQEQKIQLLQHYIFEKSELLQRLRAEGDHKRQLSKHDWAEMEGLLDSVTGGFAERLRRQHPEFSEEDVQLCMLTRMRLSNQVISDIYLITVSAVKHRKLKLKKNGFGELSPARPLDDVLAVI